jgi:hypothetical protein
VTPRRRRAGANHPAMERRCHRTAPCRTSSAPRNRAPRPRSTASACPDARALRRQRRGGNGTDRMGHCIPARLVGQRSQERRLCDRRQAGRRQEEKAQPKPGLVALWGDSPRPLCRRTGVDGQVISRRAGAAARVMARLKPQSLRNAYAGFKSERDESRAKDRFCVTGGRERGIAEGERITKCRPEVAGRCPASRRLSRRSSGQAGSGSRAGTGKLLGDRCGMAS